MKLGERKRKGYSWCERLGGGFLEGYLFNRFKTEETGACLYNGKECPFKGHISKPMQRN